MKTERYWINTSVADDFPEQAVFGPRTVGIVDNETGGMIAYVHEDNAGRVMAAFAAFRNKEE
jgi:hypothetical protein